MRSGLASKCSNRVRWTACRSVEDRVRKIVADRRVARGGASLAAMARTSPAAAPAGLRARASHRRASRAWARLLPAA